MKNSANNDISLLYPLSKEIPSLSHLMCVGQDVSLRVGDFDVKVAGIFMSDANDLVFLASDLPEQAILDEVLSYLKSWRCSTLDSICSDYTFKAYGQAFRLIDVAARRGTAVFSKNRCYEKTIDSKMEKGDFYLFHSRSNAM